MGRARNRGGFGWKRWTKRWLYEELRLSNGYRVHRMGNARFAATPERNTVSNYAATRVALALGAP